MPSSDATRLLTAAKSGDDAAAAKLAPLVYDELRRLAGHYLGEHVAGAVTLQPTALVHEAYIRLIGGDGRDFRSRTHFFAAAAGAMRHILIDHARARRAGKRGGGARPLTLIESDGDLGDGQSAHDLLELNELLERLAKLSPRAARVVDLRVFGGVTAREIAGVLNISERTVKEDWRIARAWLRSELKRNADDDP
jgi:RNA polymerase sigma factor (TIGR02999 family)